MLSWAQYCKLDSLTLPTTVIGALPRQAPSANEVAGLSLFPMVNHVASDTDVRFDVLSTDRFGAPVANVAVALEVEAGGARRRGRPP